VQKPKKVFCYPVQMAYKCTKLEAVQYLMDKDCVHLKYKNEAVRIKAHFLQKLENLYRYNCSDDRKFDVFLTRVWCLLKRYQVR